MHQLEIKVLDIVDAQCNHEVQYAGCLSTSHHTAFSWSCPLWGTTVQQDDAISRVTWLPVTDFGVQILKCLTVMVCSH